MIIGAKQERPEPVRTKEQAVRWLDELVFLVEEARANCNLAFPGDEARTVDHQRKSLRVFDMRFGMLKGVVDALFRAGIFDEVGYDAIKKRVARLLLPTVVGSA